MKLLKVLISATSFGIALWLALRNASYAKLFASFGAVDTTTVAFVAVAILGSTALAALRLRTIAGDHGYHLTLRDSIAALTLGQIGGFLMFQLFGQLVARGSYLKQRNVPVAATVLVTFQERVSSAAVSFLLAIAGALYLFKAITFTMVGGGGELVKILSGIIVGIAAASIIWRVQIKTALSNIRVSAVLKFLRALALSFAVQITMLIAYVVATAAISPGTDFARAASAATLIMFAASIPISFAGWGIREMGALAALGAIGVSSDSALTIAILIGAISLLCVLVLAGLTARRALTSQEYRHSDVTNGQDIDGKLMAVLPVMVATLVFYQIRIPTDAAGINVNIADPFALLGAAMFTLDALRRHCWPQWRVPYVNVMIVACTIVLTISLLIGAAKIGWTTWAVTNKYAGWFVLLAYGMTGALALRAGTTKVLRTYVVVGCTVVVVCAIQQLILTSPELVDVAENGYFPGFAQNSNAFAFQCLMALAISLALPLKQPIWPTIAFAGIWFASSRAGFAAGIGVLALAAVIAAMTTSGALLERRNLKRSAAIAAIGCISLLAVATTLSFGCANNQSSAAVWCGFPRFLASAQAASNSEHLLTLKSGLSIFLSHPLFGAGLGTYIYETGLTGRALQIHSTTVWLLAEFGLVGLLVFALPVVMIAWSELRSLRSRDFVGKALLLILAGFAIMSLAHELLYQRNFWFLMGALLAAPYLPRREHVTSST